MKTDKIVVLDHVVAYGIYDTVEDSFIGFGNGNDRSHKLKYFWTAEGYAKSAFKLHTGEFFRDQTRYQVRTL